MPRSDFYNGGITREQFLFYEMRIVARKLIEGIDRDTIVQQIIDENLFQFPTEKMIGTIAKGCFRRIDALDSTDLIEDLAFGSVEVAKQINLYAMMRYNKIVWDFMVEVIGEKFKTRDLELDKKDFNLFITNLREKDERIDTWSDQTFNKIKQVLKKCLVECDFLDSTKSTKLNEVYLYDEVLCAMRKNGDEVCMPAFNHMEG